jgi:hypothetical protein
MGASVLLRFLPERGLTAMRKRPMRLRAEQGITAPFLRPAAAGRLELNTAFVTDHPRT